ncbi:hypothetical protein [Streptomyces sp. NPDC001380]|uniref:hypothetical protein n=1 Tax=Streptomyces sp. NPDC001380 TaxID=3364566 RepID=UPI0036B81D4F
MPAPGDAPRDGRSAPPDRAPRAAGAPGAADAGGSGDAAADRPGAPAAALLPGGAADLPRLLQWITLHADTAMLLRLREALRRIDAESD